MSVLPPLHSPKPMGAQMVCMCGSFPSGQQPFGRRELTLVTVPPEAYNIKALSILQLRQEKEVAPFST